MAPRSPHSRVARATPTTLASAPVVRVETGEARADAAVAWFFGGKTPKSDDLTAEQRAAPAVAALLASGDFKAEFKDTLIVYPGDAAGGAPRLLVVGLGERGKLTLDRVRQLGARVAKRARDAGARSLSVPLPPADADALAVARALAEGVVLGLYRFTKYKTQTKKPDEPEKRLERVTILAGDDALKAAREGASRGVVVAESVNMTRAWATLSGDDAWAENIAKEAQAMARGAGLRCEVFDERKIRALGMGGVLAVNRGSPREPRFVVLEHGREHKGKSGTVVLVGKGVTFDSGGLSIKPAEKMDEMKFDKAGAAAVWGAMRALALLEAPVHVVGLTPLVENLPSGTAMKPGDVFHAYGGKSFEVLNTDAEGRLILADALAYSREFEPDAVIDIATLTGHIVVALGALCSGVMGNDARLMARFKESSERVHERVCEMPFFDEYGEMVKGKYADVRNHAGRPAGAITAGKFLEAFVPDGVPWVHVDIAGTGWDDGANPGFNSEYSPGQATGVGVRTFVDFIESWREAPLLRSPRPTRGARAGRSRRAR